ncbi:TonB-dependent receptor [Psychromonas hadalis]|uniref:TonB-dependent receptor n=1 Tax=Psychromonas hadalis TaxID=211669 RepID=UPI0003B738E6|nr:TonB-dependent receptor [Psychromonas hadalis]
MNTINTPVLLSTLAISFIAPSFVFAETANETPSMVIYGVATPEKHRLTDITPVVTVDRDTFEDQAGGQLITDIVKRLPGVYTGGAPGENKDVRIRGLDKEFSRVELDGIQLPDGGEKRELNINRIPASMVKEIKLIRNSSAEYEADGLAGRIQIELRDIPLQQQFEMSVSAGGQNNLDAEGKQLSLTYGNRINEQFGLQGTFSLIETPLIKSKNKYNEDGLALKSETEEKSIENLTAIWDLAYFYGDGDSAIHIKPLYIKDNEQKTKLINKFDKEGLSVKSTESEYEDKTKETVGLSIGNIHIFNELTQIDSKLGYYRTTEEKDKNKQKGKNKSEKEIEDKEDAFWQGDIKLSHRWHSGFKNDFKTGISIRQRERHRNKDKYSNGEFKAGNAKDNYRIEEDYSAFFLQNKMYLTDAFSLQVGARVEHVKLVSFDTQDKQGGSSQTDILPSLSANYKINNSTAFYASASQVLNRPKFDEITPFENEEKGEVTIGNPDLKTAKANAFDLGVNFVTDPLFLGINLFYRDISDVIESRATGDSINDKPVYQVQNVGDGYLKGIELEQRWALRSLNITIIDQFTITANQSFIRSKLENEDGSTTPFKSQPNFIGNVIVDWLHPTAYTRASLALNYISDIEVNEVNNGQESEAYLDFKITQPIGQYWSVYASGNNLTNVERVKLKSNGDKETESTGRLLWVGLNGKF